MPDSAHWLQWPGRENYLDAHRRLGAGDLDRAITAFTEAIGPEGRTYSDEERPFVAAAWINLAGAIDRLGDARAALVVYDKAFAKFAGDGAMMRQHPWLQSSFAGARTRRDWLAERAVDV